MGLAASRNVKRAVLLSACKGVEIRKEANIFE
jgi:hypothetical protein